MLALRILKLHLKLCNKWVLVKWFLQFGQDFANIIHLFSPQASGQHMGTEFSNQGGSSMQVDRGSPWMSGPPENSTVTQHSGLPGPPPIVPSQMGPGNQLPRSQPVIYLQLFKFRIN